MEVVGREADERGRASEKEPNLQGDLVFLSETPS